MQTVTWSKMPDGLSLRLKFDDQLNRVIPILTGSPQAIERWSPSLRQIAQGDKADQIRQEADGSLIFHSFNALPNRDQMPALFGTEVGTTDMPLTDVLMDAQSVHWAFDAGWVSEAGRDEILGTEPYASQSDTKLSVDQVLNAYDEMPWIDLSPYGMSLVLRETTSAYQDAGGDRLIPFIEAAPSVLERYSEALTAIGLKQIEHESDTEKGLLTYFVDFQSIPPIQQWKEHLAEAVIAATPTGDIVRYAHDHFFTPEPAAAPETASVAEPAAAGLESSPSASMQAVEHPRAENGSIDFSQVDYLPLQDAMTASLIDRVKGHLDKTVDDELPKPVIEGADDLIKVASQHLAIDTAEFDRSSSNFSVRELQEQLEASGVRAASQLIRDALNTEPSASAGYAYELAERSIDVLQALLPSMDIRSGQSQELMQYSTPLPISVLAQKTLGITPDDQRSLYEPTAGNGSLVAAANPANVSGFELDPKRVQRLQDQGLDIQQGNALKNAAEARSKDIVIMNPPFGGFPDNHGARYERYFSSLDQKARIDVYKQDQWIALKHLEVMKDDGTAFLVLGAESPIKHAPGETSSKTHAFRQMLADNYNIVGEAWVSGKTYAKQGAGWPLHVIAIKGRHPELTPVDIERSLPVIHDLDQLREVMGQWEKVLGADLPDLGKDLPERSSQSPSASNGDQEAPAKETEQVAEAPADEEPASESAADLENVTETAALAESEAEEDASLGDDSTQIEQDAEQKLAASLDPSESEAEEEIDAAAMLIDYVPESKMPSLNKKVPANLAGPIRKGIERVKAAVGDFDDFIMLEMGWSEERLRQSLGAEQVDAVALSIYQARQGKGMIVADKTGVGKGRTAATMIAWGVKNGFKPIFLTEKAGLFTDMARDLRDIGEIETVSPYIVNEDPNANVHDDNPNPDAAPDDKGPLRWSKGSSRLLDEAFQQPDMMPEGRNAIFATYSQFNTLSEKNRKAQWLQVAATDSLMILDEAHNAAGPSSNTGVNLAAALEQAAAATYVSATPMKNPQNTGIYMHKTSLGDNGHEETVKALEEGGAAIIESATAMLAAEGMYIARSHPVNSTPEIKVIDEETSRRVTGHDVREVVDAMAKVYDLFNYLSGETQSVVQAENELLAKSLSKKETEDFKKNANWGSQAIHFASRMWQFDKAFRYIMKAPHAVEEAMRAIEEGRRPLIAIDGTMESFLRGMRQRELTEKENAGELNSSGDRVESKATYRDTLHKLLPGLIQVKRYDRYGNVEEADIFDLDEMRTAYLNDELPSPPEIRATMSKEELQAEQQALAFFAAEEAINALPEDLPASPIDWMRAELARHGVKAVEATGRELGLDYSNPESLSYYERTALDRNIRHSIDSFNNGDGQVLIANETAFTGYSMHGSVHFNNTEDRETIFIDPPLDPNKFMQAMGRTDRTGAVENYKAHFTVLNLPIPSEIRPTANMIRKLSLLSAGTSANRDTGIEMNTVDLFNEVGDLAVTRVLEERADGHDIASRLGYDLKTEIEDQKDRKYQGVKSDFARKFTGRMLALPIDMQEELYAAFADRTESYIAALEEEGINPFKAHIEDLRAETVETTAIEPPTGTSEFMGPVNARVIEYDRAYKPVDPERVKESIAVSRQIASKRGAKDGYLLKEMLPQIAAQTVGRSTVMLKKLFPEACDWNDPEGKAAWLKGLASDPESSDYDYPTKKHKQAAMTYANNAAWFEKIKMFAENLVPGQVIQDYPLNPQYFSNPSATLVVGGVKPPMSDPSLMGSWRLQLYSPDPEVGRMELSLQQLLSGFEGAGTANQLNTRFEQPIDDEMIDHLFTADQGSEKTFKVKRIVLTGNLFKAHKKAKEIKAGHIGFYTDKKGIKHLGVLMPTSMNETLLTRQLQKTTFTIAESKVVGDYMDHLKREMPNHAVVYSTDAYERTFNTSSNKHNRMEPGSGVIIHHASNTGAVRIMISAAKKNNKKLVADDALVKNFLNGDFEQDSGNKKVLSAYLKPGADLHKMLGHLVKKHQLAFVGEPHSRDWYNGYMQSRFEVQCLEEGLDPDAVTKQLDGEEVDQPEKEKEKESLVRQGSQGPETLSA